MEPCRYSKAQCMSGMYIDTCRLTGEAKRGEARQGRAGQGRTGRAGQAGQGEEGKTYWGRDRASEGMVVEGTGRAGRAGGETWSW